MGSTNIATLPHSRFSATKAFLTGLGKLVYKPISNLYCDITPTEALYKAWQKIAVTASS